MKTMTRAARHVGTTAGPAEQALQAQAYQNRYNRSTVNFLGNRPNDCDGIWLGVGLWGV